MDKALPCGVGFFNEIRGVLHLTIVCVRVYRLYHLFSSSKALLELHRKQRQAKMSLDFFEKVDARDNGDKMDVSPSGFVWRESASMPKTGLKPWPVRAEIFST